jgi:hypothetical protein
MMILVMIIANTAALIITVGSNNTGNGSCDNVDETRLDQVTVYIWETISCKHGEKYSAEPISRKYAVETGAQSYRNKTLDSRA